MLRCPTRCCTLLCSMLWTGHPHTVLLLWYHCSYQSHQCLSRLWPLWLELLASLITKKMLVNCVLGLPIHRSLSWTSSREVCSFTPKVMVLYTSCASRRDCDPLVLFITTKWVTQEHWIAISRPVFTSQLHAQLLHVVLSMNHCLCSKSLHTLSITCLIWIVVVGRYP